MSSAGRVCGGPLSEHRLATATAQPLVHPRPGSAATRHQLDRGLALTLLRGGVA
jgi:hypothetical protein